LQPVKVGRFPLEYYRIGIRRRNAVQICPVSRNIYVVFLRQIEDIHYVRGGKGSSIGKFNVPVKLDSQGLTAPGIGIANLGIEFPVQQIVDKQSLVLQLAMTLFGETVVIIRVGTVTPRSAPLDAVEIKGLAPGQGVGRNRLSAARLAAAHGKQGTGADQQYHY